MATTDVTAYFAWHKFPGNRAFRQSEDIKSYLGNRWNSLSVDEQEEIIDDYFVDTEIRRQYQDEASASDFPPSFPKLMIPNGEKIMVDENDVSKTEIVQFANMMMTGNSGPKGALDFTWLNFWMSIQYFVCAH